MVPECRDSGSCAAGFVLDDQVFYHLGCLAVRNTAVSDEVLGQGEIDGQPVTASAVESQPRSLMVAVSLPGGVCSETDPDTPLSDWTMAFPDGADNAAVRQAICEAGELSAVQREANGC